jgi:hypothetical protein
MAGIDLRRSLASEKFLFPAVGVVAGVVAFTILYLVWPADVAGPVSGRAAASSAARSTETPLSGLAQVRDLKAVTGSRAVTVSWTALSGPPGISYVAKAVPEDAQLETRTCTTSAGSCVIDGLTNGAPYTIEVRIQDGDGALSAPQLAAATPRPDILASESSALWLDADDTSAFGGSAATAGAPVSEWHDKSGRGSVVTQAATTAQPLVAVLGKRRALKFSGSQSLAVADSRLPSGTDPSTVFVVVRLDDVDAAKSCFEHVLAWGSAQPGAARILHKGCSTLMAYVETYGTGTTITPTKAWPIGRTALLSASITKSGLDVRMNGSPSYSWTAPADVPTNTASHQPFTVGGALWWGGSAGWVGLIGEVAVLSGAVSPADRNDVEQYLVRKWSIS